MIRVAQVTKVTRVIGATRLSRMTTRVTKNTQERMEDLTNSRTKLKGATRCNFHIPPRTLNVGAPCYFLCPPYSELDPTATWYLDRHPHEHIATATSWCCCYHVALQLYLHLPLLQLLYSSTITEYWKLAPAVCACCARDVLLRPHFEKSYLRGGWYIFVPKPWPTPKKGLGSSHCHLSHTPDGWAARGHHSGNPGHPGHSANKKNIVGATFFVKVRGNSCLWEGGQTCFMRAASANRRCNLSTSVR